MKQWMPLFSIFLSLYAIADSAPSAEIRPSVDHIVTKDELAQARFETFSTARSQFLDLPPRLRVEIGPRFLTPYELETALGLMPLNLRATNTGTISQILLACGFTIDTRFTGDETLLKASPSSDFILDLGDGRFRISSEPDALMSALRKLNSYRDISFEYITRILNLRANRTLVTGESPEILWTGWYEPITTRTSPNMTLGQYLRLNHQPLDDLFKAMMMLDDSRKYRLSDADLTRDFIRTLWFEDLVYLPPMNPGSDPAKAPYVTLAIDISPTRSGDVVGLPVLPENLTAILRTAYRMSPDLANELLSLRGFKGHALNLRGEYSIKWIQPDLLKQLAKDAEPIIEGQFISLETYFRSRGIDIQTVMTQKLRPHPDSVIARKKPHRLRTLGVQKTNSVSQIEDSREESTRLALQSLELYFLEASESQIHPRLRAAGQRGLDLLKLREKALADFKKAPTSTKLQDLLRMLQTQKNIVQHIKGEVEECFRIYDPESFRKNVQPWPATGSPESHSEPQ